MSSKYVPPHKKQITNSFGMILCSKVNGVVKYGLVKRRYCYGLRKMLECDFSKERYFQQVSNAEREALLYVCAENEHYEMVFRNLWSLISFSQTPSDNEIYHGLRKFLQNKQRIQDGLNTSISVYPDGIWFFPKGRKGQNETDLQTAFREVYEETTLASKNVYVRHSIKRQSDTYNKEWNSTYYIGFVNERHAVNKHIHCREIEMIVWLDVNDTLQCIPNDMQGIKDIVAKIHNQVNNLI